MFRYGSSVSKRDMASREIRNLKRVKKVKKSLIRAARVSRRVWRSIRFQERVHKVPRKGP